MSWIRVNHYPYRSCYTDIDTCAFITRVKTRAQGMGRHLKGLSMELLSLEVPNSMTGVLVEKGCLISYPAGVQVADTAASDFRAQTHPSGGLMLTSNVNRNSPGPFYEKTLA